MENELDTTSAFGHEVCGNTAWIMAANGLDSTEDSVVSVE